MNVKRLYEIYARNNNLELNEADFQKFQQKLGSKLTKLGKSLSSPTISKFGQKMSTNRLPYNVGAKLDRSFNTQGYQHRKATVQKYSNSKKVVDNITKLINMWNSTMNIKYKTVRPETIDQFNKDLEVLINKYMDKL